MSTRKCPCGFTDSSTMKNVNGLSFLRNELRKHASKRKAKTLQSFFKTGPGQYAQGDVFLGVTVPCIRKIAKKYVHAPHALIVCLLQSRIHEERLLALIILVTQFQDADESSRKKIYTLYLKKTRYINNWDLVDLTAAHIVGAYLYQKNKTPLYTLARSLSLWERRIAIIATFYYIKNGVFSHTLRIAAMLLSDDQDLMHKATGWMLREVGKRNARALETFLRTHYTTMPRTMLRYAIERFPEKKRKRYLNQKRRFVCRSQ